MEKSFTAQLGAGEQGPQRVSSQPCRMNCSAVTSTRCVRLLGSLCGVRTRLLTRGQGTREGWRGGDRTPSYTSLEATPPVHLLGPNCSGVPISAAPRHPDCRPLGSLMTPSPSHHTSQAASPAPKPGDSSPFLSASPPPGHPGPGPESVHLSLDSHSCLLPQQLPAFAQAVPSAWSSPSAPFWPALCSRPPKRGIGKHRPLTVRLDSVDFTCVNVDNNGNSLPVLQDPLALLCGFSTVHITCSFSLPVPTPSIILTTTRAQVPSRRVLSLLNPQGLA